MRIELLQEIVKNIDMYTSPDDIFNIVSIKKESIIKDNHALWRVICNSLWNLKQCNKKLPYNTGRSNCRIDMLVGLVNNIDEYSSSNELYDTVVKKSKDKPVINRNLTFWQEICNSIWFVYDKYCIHE